MKIDPEIITCRRCDIYMVKDENDLCALCYAESVDMVYDEGRDNGWDV